MTLSEKRKKWLTTKGLKNCFAVSFGVLIIAIIYKSADILLDVTLPYWALILSAFAFIGITVLMLVLSGIANPDLTNKVFEMLGFKEENEAKQEKSNGDEENNEKNDFSKLVDEHFVEGNNDKEFIEALKVTLKILLEKRLDFHSQSLITSIKLSVSIILGLIAIIPTFFSLLTGNFYLLVISAVVLVIVFAVTEQTITRRKLKKEDEEREIIGQYLKAIAELNRRNQE